MNKLRKKRSCVHASIRKRALTSYHIAREHERTHKEDEKPCAFKYWEKSFTQLSTCKQHERTLTGVKPYTCKHCKKCFSQSSSCKRHERTLPGKKPYTCKCCDKCFSRLSVCKQHKRTNTVKKPYTWSCKHCKKCFSQLSHCKQHERVHTGEKLYTCQHFQKSFSQSSSCKRHERKHARDRSLKDKQHGLELRRHLKTLSLVGSLKGLSLDPCYFCYILMTCLMPQNHLLFTYLLMILCMQEPDWSWT